MAEKPNNESPLSKAMNHPVVQSSINRNTKAAKDAVKATLGGELLVALRTNAMLPLCPEPMKAALMSPLGAGSTDYVMGQLLAILALLGMDHVSDPKAKKFLDVFADCCIGGAYRQSVQKIDLVTFIKKAVGGDLFTRLSALVAEEEGKPSAE